MDRQIYLFSVRSDILVFGRGHERIVHRKKVFSMNTVQAPLELNVTRFDI